MACLRAAKAKGSSSTLPSTCKTENLSKAREEGFSIFRFCATLNGFFVQAKQPSTGCAARDQVGPVSKSHEENFMRAWTPERKGWRLTSKTELLGSLELKEGEKENRERETLVFLFRIESPPDRTFGGTSPLFRKIPTSPPQMRA